MKIDFKQMFEFSKTHVEFGRPLGTYTKVQYVVSYLIRNRFPNAQLRRSRHKEYLNVGCGPNQHRDFVNLDYIWKPGVDLCWDVEQTLPFHDDTLAGIYSEHCIEHLDEARVPGVFSEFRRVLRPGGHLRVIVPDAELYLNLYIKARAGHSVQFPYADEFDGSSAICHVNRMFRNHEHQYAYDFAYLAQLLSTSGFEVPRKQAFGIGDDATLLIDTPSRAVESLYVEASKPTDGSKTAVQFGR